MKYKGICLECGSPVDFDYPKALTETEINQIAALKCKSIHIETGQAYGVCVYCGQYSSFGFQSGLTQEERNRHATRVCTCREAQYYARLEEQIESAKFRIGMLFGEGAEDYGFSPVKNEASIEFLGTIAEQIANRNIQSAQVQLTGRIKAKISLTVKGNIKVERSETTKQQLEE